jgi:pimeloyl-ACP methyl ester carboxylesterase
MTSIFLAGVAAASTGHAASEKPTIVLVHGAFAQSAIWDGVIADLAKDGYPAVAAPNNLRGVASDAAAVSALVKSIHGPVVLVGHSYGGSVISAAAADAPNVKALVFVAAFAPEIGETSGGLNAKFPGSTLGPALAPPVVLPDGTQDLYVRRERFPAQFAADVPLAKARLMAAEQRPVAAAAFDEKIRVAAWKTLPSWSIYGTKDLDISPATMKFMAARAHSRKTVVVPGAAHLPMVSHPHEVAALIEAAAAGSRPAPGTGAQHR